MARLVKLQQPDLFGAVEADRYPNSPGFARGSDTSEAAAQAVKPRLGHLHLRILHHLTDQGDHGSNYTEIMEACSLGAPTVTGRLRELVLQGFIRDSGERRQTPSKCSARVYVRTAKTYEISGG